MLINEFFMPSTIELKDMLKSAVHFGHKTSNWHPKMAPYIYGAREGIHIFDLMKTKGALEEAVEFMGKMTKDGKKILFVATKPQASKIVEEACKEAKIPYVTHKWISGLLTNFNTVRARIRYFRKLKEEEQTGDFDKYTKAEASKLRKEMVKLEERLGGLGDMTGLPDAIFVLDAIRDKIAIVEASKLGIPVIAICDSNADPSGIDRIIPGNDDSVLAIEYYVNAATGAIKASRK